MLMIDHYETPEDDKVLRGRVMALLGLCKKKAILYPDEIIAMLGGYDIEILQADKIGKMKEDMYVERK